MSDHGEGFDLANFWAWATTPGNLPAAELQKLLDADRPPVEWPRTWDYAGGIEAIKAQIDQANASRDELAWQLAAIIANLPESMRASAQSMEKLQGWLAARKNLDQPGGYGDTWVKIQAEFDARPEGETINKFAKGAATRHPITEKTIKNRLYKR